MISKEKVYLFLSDSLFRNASYLLANSIVGSVAGFAFWLIAARLYTAEDVGLASTVISAIGLIALISNLGFSLSLIRFLSEYKDKSTNLSNSCLTVSTSVGLILTLIFLLCIDLFSPSLSFIKSNKYFVIIFIVLTLLMIVSNLQDSIFVGHRNAKLSFTKMTIQAILKIPVLFFMITFGSFGIVTSYWIAFLISVSVASLILIPMIDPNYFPKFVIDLIILKKNFLYSAANYIAWFFESILNFILPLLITRLLYPEMTAYFYVVWMFAGVVFIVPKAIATSLFAEGSHDETSLKENANKSIKLTLMCIIPFIATILLIGDKILLFYGVEYSINGSMLLKVLTISAIPMTFNTIYITIKRVKKDLRTVIFANAGITIGTMAITIFSIDHLGILGVGLGWGITQIVILIYLYHNMHTVDTSPL